MEALFVVLKRGNNWSKRYSPMLLDTALLRYDIEDSAESLTTGYRISAVGQLRTSAESLATGYRTSAV